MINAKILVVEDERIVGRAIQVTLQKAGYQILGVVPSGDQAIQMALETSPDLILMDVMLSGEMDGVEAARQIRSKREVPVVYLTANGDRTTLERTKETEPIAFIRKPYDEQELLTTIEICLHQYQAHKKRTEAALLNSEARYQELFESARDGIAITDIAGKPLRCNRAYLQLLGFDKPDVIPAPFMLVNFIAPDHREPEARSLREQTLRRGYSDMYERDFIRQDGTRVTINARMWLRRDEEGEPVGFWLMAHDISERKETERRLLKYQERLQSLMRELSVAEERERQQIASDIHDRVSQTLAVCQLRLAAVAQPLDANGSTAQEIAEVCQLLDLVIQDTSSLIFDLSPPVLYQLGLVPAIEWFAEKVQKRHRLRVQVRAKNFDVPVANDQRAALFRATCELINNSVKHARANRIWILLEQRSGILRIEVTDNGIGFTPAEQLGRKRDRGGFGLFHINERLRGWGGSLEIKSKPGIGTRALLAMPMQAEEKVSQPYANENISG